MTALDEAIAGVEDRVPVYDIAGHAAALLAAAKTIRLLYDALLAQEDRLRAVEERLDRIEDRIGDTIGMGG